MLQFFASIGKPLTIIDVLKSDIGQKDMQKGLFTIWEGIFQVIFQTLFLLRPFYIFVNYNRMHTDPSSTSYAKRPWQQRRHFRTNCFDDRHIDKIKSGKCLGRYTYERRLQSADERSVWKLFKTKNARCEYERCGRRCRLVLFYGSNKSVHQSSTKLFGLFVHAVWIRGVAFVVCEYGMAENHISEARIRGTFFTHCFCLN